MITHKCTTFGAFIVDDHQTVIINPSPDKVEWYLRRHAYAVPPNSLLILRKRDNSFCLNGNFPILLWRLWRWKSISQLLFVTSSKQNNRKLAVDSSKRLQNIGDTSYVLDHLEARDVDMF